MKQYRRVMVVLLFILIGFGLSVPTEAHEQRQVGPYEVEFGWRVEPAYAGVFNGLELTIAQGDSGEPVEGAEETLGLEVTFGPESKMLALNADFEQPGLYTVDLLPTLPGDYSFHLTGKIGDTDVDETFSSANGEFDSVEPGEDILFPSGGPVGDLKGLVEAQQAQINELTGRIDDLQAQLDAIKGQ